VAGAAALRVRTVYLGTSDFAAGVLRRLYDSAHRPTLVISRPHSPQGRGRKLTPPPTVVVAQELGVDVYQPGSVNSEEALVRIGEAEPEVLCVCAFGALIKEPLLSRYPILNVHPSLLPRWRGAAPIERAILAGDTETGVSIMRLTAGLDSGPICLQERIPIAPDDDYGSLAARLEALGGEMLVRALDEQPDCVEQSDDGVTYAEKLSADDRRLDPAEDAEAQARRVRALSPHVGAYLERSDASRLGVWEARAVDGRLELLTVQPPGKRPMAFADYERGQRH
jgi:methionyl-tRNA formyltransferase